MKKNQVFFPLRPFTRPLSANAVAENRCNNTAFQKDYETRKREKKFRSELTKHEKQKKNTGEIKRLVELVEVRNSISEFVIG